MTTLSIDRYIRVCLKAWLHCENCIRGELSHFLPSDALMKKCRACAHSCFTAVCQMLSLSSALPEAALECVLRCRDVQEETEKDELSGEVMYCGEVCRHCGEVMKNLIVPMDLN